MSFRVVAPYQPTGDQPRAIELHGSSARVRCFDEGLIVEDWAKTADVPPSSTSRWVDVGVTPDRANPWFSSGMEFLYMPDDQALFFDKPVKVGYELASMIARDGRLPLPPKPDGRSWGRPVGIGVIALWLVVAMGLFLLWRRPRRPREQPTTA